VTSAPEIMREFVLAVEQLETAILAPALAGSLA